MSDNSSPVPSENPGDPPQGDPPGDHLVDSGKPRRIKIRIPEQYKVTAEEVWADLESYLYVGFLTSPSSALGRSFIFKTLNHLEVMAISFLRPAHGSPVETQETFRAAFIAYSTFMVDGENVLASRVNGIGKLIRIFKKIPPGAQEELVKNLGALNEKAVRLHPLTEVYIHENRSRFKWLQLRNLPIHFASATGIPGTDSLGMNYSQQSWTALNRLLDQREEMESDWANSKFIGSCFNGKGVRSVDERDRAKRERERTEREDKKMQVLYRYLNRLAPDDDGLPSGKVTLPDGREAFVEKSFRAESVEALRDQLEASLSGEKDYHDKVVELRERKNAERRDSIENMRKMMYAGRLEDEGSPYQSTSTPMHGASRILGGRQAAEAYLKRMQDSKERWAEKVRRQIPMESQESQDSDKGPILDLPKKV